MNVTWDANKCCHNGNCVKTLPEVFMIENEQFVIKPENASTEAVTKTVNACPAKALKIEQ